LAQRETMGDTLTPDPALAEQSIRNPTRFVGLYHRHMKRVYAYHLMRTGNEQDAQDLTSETFLAAMDSLASYHPELSFAAWLMGIAHHKLADFYARRDPEGLLDEADDLPSPSPMPEQVTMNRMDLTRIRRVLTLLPLERADALRLRFFSDLSLREIAQVMGKTEASVKMLVYRGLQDMRERIGSGPLEEM